VKTILIGQAPSRGGDPRRPLSSGPTATALARLAGLPAHEFLRAFERRNLLDAWPGKSGKGDAFPLRAARDAAMIILPELRGRRVVFLGRNVARAFYFDGEFLKWKRCFGNGIAAVFPHPSGINLWWNKSRNERAAVRFLRRELPCRKTK
jgi:hypothetical protein